MTRIEQTRIVSVLAEIKRQLWIFLEHVWESLAHIGILRKECATRWRRWQWKRDPSNSTLTILNWLLQSYPRLNTHKWKRQNNRIDIDFFVWFRCMSALAIIFFCWNMKFVRTLKLLRLLQMNVSIEISKQIQFCLSPACHSMITPNETNNRSENVIKE